MNEEIKLVEELSEKELLEIENGENVKIGFLSEDELIPNEDYLPGEEVDKNLEISLLCPEEYPGSPNIAFCPVLNLHKHMTKWAIYRAGVRPVSGNQFAYLNPSAYGGLTYIAHPGAYGDVWEIQTNQYGYVQIYAPKDSDSCSYFNAVFPTDPKNPRNDPEGRTWGTRWCSKSYAKH